MQPFEVTKESPIPFSGMYEGKYKALYDKDGKFLKLERLAPIRELQDGLEVYERALNRLDSKDEFVMKFKQEVRDSIRKEYMKKITAYKSAIDNYEFIAKDFETSEE